MIANISIAQVRPWWTPLFKNRLTSRSPAGMKRQQGMRVLLYPHSMELGGSQLNAIQLAGAIRDRGHEVIVLVGTGPAGGTGEEVGARAYRAPGASGKTVSEGHPHDRHLVRRRCIDVVHGYEWPPIIEAFLGGKLPRRTAVVGTVMSMSVAPFLPRHVPLTVGTELIRQAAIAAGTGTSRCWSHPWTQSRQSVGRRAGISRRARFGADEVLL